MLPGLWRGVREVGPIAASPTRSTRTSTPASGPGSTSARPTSREPGSAGRSRAIPTGTTSNPSADQSRHPDSRYATIRPGPGGRCRRRTPRELGRRQRPESLTIGASVRRVGPRALRETLAPELIGRHENANCHASPDGGRRSAAGATTTRLVRRHRGHRVRRAPLKFARRASRGDASQPSRCLKEEETKRRWPHLPPAFSPIIDTPQPPEITAAKPSSPLPTHTADVTTITRGAQSSSRRCTTEQKILQPCGIPASRMARPGLEPGTPRFSVVRSGLVGGAQSLEPKRFSADRSSKQKPADYELLHAVQEMAASHLLFSPHRHPTAKDHTDPPQFEVLVQLAPGIVSDSNSGRNSARGPECQSICSVTRGRRVREGQLAAPTTA